MLAELMFYCLAVAMLVSAAAYAGERAAALVGYPRRVVWTTALALSVFFPFLMALTNDPDTTRNVLVADAPTWTVDAAIADTHSTWLPSATAALTILWLTTSFGVVCLAFVGWLRLRIAARGWVAATIDGVRVRVTDNLGPAVVGFLKPEIVVPRWLLAAPAAGRNAAIAHERSHIAAGDTMLLLVALLLVAVMPWNLPLWWQLRRLRFAIEVDCDQRVLRDGAPLDVYGEMLIAVGQRNSLIPIGAMALTEPVSQLERRIRIMTSGTHRYAALLTIGALALSASLVGVAAELDAPAMRSAAPNGVDHNAANASGSIAEAPKPTTPTTPKTPKTQPPKASEGAKPSGPSTTAGQPVERKTIDTTSHSQDATADRKPKRIHVELPMFPEEARRQGLIGRVDIAYTISANGDVNDAVVESSDPPGTFDEAALTAIRQWRFEPAIKDGQAVDTRTKIRIKF